MTSLCNQTAANMESFQKFQCESTQGSTYGSQIKSSTDTFQYIGKLFLKELFCNCFGYWKLLMCNYRHFLLLRISKFFDFYPAYYLILFSKNTIIKAFFE